MASPPYPDEKKVTPHTEALESDGSSIDAITALVAEGKSFPHV